MKTQLSEETINRLEYVVSLQKGWLGREEGDPVSHTAEQIAYAFLEQFLKKSNKNRPGIYPLIEGGISLEWDPEISNDDTSLPWTVEITNDGNVNIIFFNTDEADYDINLNYSNNIQSYVNNIIEHINTITRITIR